MIEKPVWQYTSAERAAVQLRRSATDGEARHRFEEYLERSAKELGVLAYRLSVQMLGRGELAARIREWRRQNPERCAELQRESYRKHYAKNYPRYLAQARNRRAKKSMADGTHTSAEVEQMVADQGGLCAYCECELDGRRHVDHMVPLSRGGRNDWTNLAVTCAYCNRSKGASNAESSWKDGIREALRTS